MAIVSTKILLERVLSQPTAPFREGWVRQELERVLSEAGIPCFTDPSGNLVAGCRTYSELENGFHIGLLAHMDHPGFLLGPKTKKRTHRCFWYGGAPFRTIQGARVRVYDPTDRTRTVSGSILKMEKIDESEEGLPFLVEFDQELEKFSEWSFGGFDFPGFELQGDHVVTRAADDVAGCVIALGALLDQENALVAAKKNDSKPSVKTKDRRLVAIFTRAEEVGFVGCLDLLKRGDLPQDLWLVSLEASRALPEAEIGKGPVLRIGDKTALFDAEFCSVLWTVARDLNKRSEKSAKPFQFQRRLMSGGTCEGTALMIYGHQVSAIAVPLLNYHNQGDVGAAPEIISLSDVDGARRLCFELGATLKRKPSWNRDVKKEILGYHKRMMPLLRTRVRYDSGELET